MPEKHYDWKNGPAIIQQHSIAKHTILRSYLTAYFQTLASNPQQDVFRLTLVDGFAGGGVYLHEDSRQEIEGSPFICLQSVQEAEFLLNANRKKPIKLDVNYFFVEDDRDAYLHLDKVLRRNGYGVEIGNKIQLINDKFQNHATAIIDFIKRKSPQNGRSLFIFDQYGYKNVPSALISAIFNVLPRAEVILTFGVDSLLNYANDNNFQKLIDDIALPDVLKGKSVAEIKSQEKDWRLFIQSRLYRSLTYQCGAKYFTPFFIRNARGHGDYWLIHMSQHYRARDVMTEVHWNNNNYFIHYGGSGLDMFKDCLYMLGYDATKDLKISGQTELLGFEFDGYAKESSISALMEQIPRIIYADDLGMSFESLFATTCNGSPASAMIYREAIAQLIKHKQIEVISESNQKRQSAKQIKPTDQIIPPSQRPLFL